MPEPFGTISKITSVLIDFWTLNCELKTLYYQENLYCTESIIIVNQIKVFKLNSLTK